MTVGYKRGVDVNLRVPPFGADYDDDGDDEEGSRRRCLMSGPGGIGPRTFEGVSVFSMARHGRFRKCTDDRVV